METKLKKIIAFTYPHEAQMAKTYLESYDLAIELKDEMTVQVYNFLSNAVGGVKLYVEEARADEALELLKDGGYLNEESSEMPKIEKFDEQFKNSCPYCQSENVSSERVAGLPFVLSILLLGFPLLFSHRQYFCFDCSRKWRIK